MNRRATEDVLDAMTNAGLRSQEKLFVESEDEQEQRDSPRSCASGDILRRTTWTEARRPAGLKAS